MREAEWAETASTPDLFWHLHGLIQQIQTYERRADEPDLTPEKRSLYVDEAALSRELAACAVAELRRRGERVDWEG